MTLRFRSTTSLRAQAKQSIAQQKERMDCFVASAPRNDGKTQLRDLAAWFFARGIHLFPLSSNKGRRECRALDAPDSHVCDGSG
jgi:hypothetical protein